MLAVALLQPLTLIPVLLNDPVMTLISECDLKPGQTPPDSTHKRQYHQKDKPHCRNTVVDKDKG
jgi:hypothetical protein